jgi:hypothetical protein
MLDGAIALKEMRMSSDPREATALFHLAVISELYVGIRSRWKKPASCVETRERVPPYTRDADVADG